MKHRAAHTIERSIVAQKNDISRDFLDAVLDEVGQRPDGLPTVFRREVQLAAGLAQDPGTAGESAGELARGARVAALMFVHAWHANAHTLLAIDGQLRVDLQGEVDATVVNAPAWIDAMWCAIACGDELAQQWLATVPPTKLHAAGVQHARYAAAEGELLRSLVLRDGRHAEWLARAIEAAGDEGDAVLQATREWADLIELPALRAAYHWLGGDAEGFSEALERLHEAHRERWSSAGNRLAVDGLLSLRGCALLRLASAANMETAFESAYMPRSVWRAAARPHPVRCPYCVVPLSAGAAICGPCGRAIHDAPLELDASPGPRTPCRQCAHPLPTMAVLCPQCRTSVSST